MQKKIVELLNFNTGAKLARDSFDIGILNFDYKCRKYLKGILKMMSNNHILLFFNHILEDS